MQPRLYGSRTAGAALGLLALGAGLAAAELVVALVNSAPSPVVAVGQAVIDLVPPGVKDWAIAVFGTSNKLALITGTLIILAMLGALVGILATRGKRTSAFAMVGVVGVIGMLAVITRATSALTDVLPTLFATATTMAVLWWFTRTPSRLSGHPDAAETHRASPMGLDRRSMLLGIAGVAAASAAVGGVGRWLQRGAQVASERAGLILPTIRGERAQLPATADFDIDGLEPFITANDRFFRIDTALTVPQVSREAWRLRIHGMVDQELDLGFEDLSSRPQVERYLTLACVSNDVGGRLIGNALWQGVLLADVLREAGVQPGADQLVSRSVDGWTCGTPTQVVLDGRDALLAFGMNGEALPTQHGYPVRMVVPGLFGYVSATKWLTEIELTTWDAFDAYWTTRGWSREGPVKTMARIDRPRRDRGWSSGPLEIAGVAWAIHRGVSSVQVRIDEGEWLSAELAGVPSVDTWRQWRLSWDALPGEHLIEARAIDGNGVVQPSQRRSVAPDGAQGYHRVRVTVD
jgi:DMSO/TMAO reductase YedYZ molybdopterin-dependent catalytic subunit